MTASELFAIVEGVPREAWPERCYYHPGEGWNRHDKDFDPECGVTASHAALMFTASFLEWLHRREYSVTTYISGCEAGQSGPLTDSQIMCYSVECEPENDSEAIDETAGTLLEALAAACREVGNG